MGREAKMNVLVTGGCGYLGSVVVDRLKNEGYDVTVFDSMLYGKIDTGARTVIGDVTDDRALSKALEHKEAVVHLAAIVGEGACNLEKEMAVKVNYMAARSLAVMCRERNVRLIFPSTASVYGSSETDSLLDEQSPLSPLSVYAITKVAAEDSIRNCCEDYVILRLGTLHGISRRMRFDLVGNRFIAMGASGQKIVVFGGSQHRPFLHLQDASDFIIQALDSDSTGLFNVGGTNYEILDLARTISTQFGTSLSVLFELKDPRDYKICSDLAMHTFGTNFKRTIDDSIKEITPFVRRNDYRDSKFSNEEWLRMACAR